MKLPIFNFSKSPDLSLKPVNLTGTKPLKSGKKNDNAIILQIAKAFKDRSRKDIDRWRMALAISESPDNPRLTLYCDLIEDLMTDGTLFSQIQLRKSATLATGFQIRNVKTGEVNDQATDFFTNEWFFQFLEIGLNSIITGTKIVEFQSFEKKNVEFSLIPPRNVVPMQRRIYPDLTRDNQFFDYSAPEFADWLVCFNEENPLGIINNIVPNLIWKRNAAQSWAEFCEKFGMPLVSATTNNNKQEHLDKVEQQLLSLAEMSVGVFPEGTTIKFDEANRTDAFNVYSEFIKQNSNEISAALVGSTTLSNEAANRSQTEVHERSLDFKISQEDRRRMRHSINRDLLPILLNQGYKFISPDDVFEWAESKEEIDLNNYWTIISEMLMNGYEIEQEWLSETFNIPITGKNENANFLNQNPTPLSFGKESGDRSFSANFH